MTNLLWPVLNIRCTCMVQKTSHMWMLYFEWLQSQHYESSDCPHPHYRQPSPSLYGSITFTHLKRFLVWLNYPTYVKKQRENLYGYIKQLSLNHVSIIGLNTWTWTSWKLGWWCVGGIEEGREANANASRLRKLPNLSLRSGEWSADDVGRGGGGCEGMTVNLFIYMRE